MSERPIPETCFACAQRGAGRSWVSYLALHPMGFSLPRSLRRARCALTAPFHHHRRLAPSAVCFLWHCPSTGLEAGCLSVSPVKPELLSIAPYGVRTFLPRLAPGAILHPSKTRHKIAYPCPKPQLFIREFNSPTANRVRDGVADGVASSLWLDLSGQVGARLCDPQQHDATERVCITPSLRRCQAAAGRRPALRRKSVHPLSSSPRCLYHYWLLPFQKMG